MNKVTLFSLLVLCGTALSWGQQGVPEEAVRHMTKGEAAVETAQSQGDYQSAISEFKQACLLAPNWPDPYYNLASVQETAGEYEEAIKNFQKYLTLAPNAEDAADVQKRIYKLEYKRDRSNIEGIWKADPNKLAVKCDPTACVFGKGHLMQMLSMFDDMQLEVRKSAKGLEARILTSRYRYSNMLPDGPFSPIEHDGDVVRMLGLTLYTCKAVIMEDNCPLEVKLVLRQSAADVLEGTVDASGGINAIVNYQGFQYEYRGFTGTGTMVFQKDNSGK